MRPRLRPPRCCTPADRARAGLLTWCHTPWPSVARPQSSVGAVRVVRGPERRTLEQCEGLGEAAGSLQAAGRGGEQSSEHVFVTLCPASDGSRSSGCERAFGTSEIDILQGYCGGARATNLAVARLPRRGPSSHRCGVTSPNARWRPSRAVPLGGGGSADGGERRAVVQLPGVHAATRGKVSRRSSRRPISSPSTSPFAPALRACCRCRRPSPVR